MRPVAILQHDQTQRPGVLLSCLDEWGVPSTTVMPEEGDRVPRRARDFGGIVLLGSNRSVNDAPGWIDEELRLLRDAAVAGVPLLGHCFGAQLMARSMGASVSRNAWPNIGWSRLPTTGEGRRLFPSASVVSFNRHYETFAIPHGAKRLSYGSHCLNKPFSIGPTWPSSATSRSPRRSSGNGARNRRPNSTGRADPPYRPGPRSCPGWLRTCLNCTARPERCTVSGFRRWTGAGRSSVSPTGSAPSEDVAACGSSRRRTRRRDRGWPRSGSRPCLADHGRDCSDRPRGAGTATPATKSCWRDSVVERMKAKPPHGDRGSDQGGRREQRGQHLRKRLEDTNPTHVDWRDVTVISRPSHRARCGEYQITSDGRGRARAGAGRRLWKIVMSNPWTERRSFRRRAIAAPHASGRRQEFRPLHQDRIALRRAGRARRQGRLAISDPDQLCSRGEDPG